MKSELLLFSAKCISRKAAKPAKEQRGSIYLIDILCRLCTFPRTIGCPRIHTAGSILLLSILTFSSILSSAQNLIPNPGFEEHKECKGLNTVLSEWQTPVGNYYHYLSDCPVPKAMYGGEEKNKPFKGKGFAGICLHTKEASEYFMVKLSQPLQAGTQYIFSGYLLLADEKRDEFKNFGQLEVAFTSKGYNVSNPSYIFFNNQITIPIDFMKHQKDWFYVSGKFIATGNESYLLIGDFLPETPLSEELNEYMGLAPEEREKYLKKHRTLEEAMDIISADLIKSPKPYSIRCYMDELCLMAASDTSKGLCNYPLWTLPPPPPKIEPFKPIVIENIFFETGKSALLPKSFKALDSLATWLKKNPKVEIQISGHTDNIGNEKDNNKLSADRAASVKNYLVSRGTPNNISSTGYGSTKPIAGNETEEGRSKNRRVEFVITKQ